MDEQACQSYVVIGFTQWRYIRDAAFLYAAHFDLVKEATAKSPRRHMPGFEHSIYHVAGIAQLEVAGHRKALPLVDEFYLPVKSTPGLGHSPLRDSTLKQALMVASQANAFVSKDRAYGMLQIPGLPDLKINVDYKKIPWNSVQGVYDGMYPIWIRFSWSMEVDCHLPMRTTTHRRKKTFLLGSPTMERNAQDE